MNDFIDQPPADTTDYRDEDVLTRREREREALFKQQRAQMDEAINTVSADDGPEEPNTQPERNEAEFIAQRDVEIRNIALASVLASNFAESFDDLMNNAQTVYDWLTGGGPQGAAGGPETA